jgi:hypothetical protein
VSLPLRFQQKGELSWAPDDRDLVAARSAMRQASRLGADWFAVTGEGQTLL